MTIKTSGKNLVKIEVKTEKQWHHQVEMDDKIAEIFRNW